MARNGPEKCLISNRGKGRGEGEGFRRCRKHKQHFRMVRATKYSMKHFHFDSDLFDFSWIWFWKPVNSTKIPYDWADSRAKVNFLYSLFFNSTAGPIGASIIAMSPSYVIDRNPALALAKPNFDAKGPSATSAANNNKTDESEKPLLSATSLTTFPPLRGWFPTSESNETRRDNKSCKRNWNGENSVLRLPLAMLNVERIVGDSFTHGDPIDHRKAVNEKLSNFTKDDHAIIIAEMREPIDADGEIER